MESQMKVGGCRDACLPRRTCWGGGFAGGRPRRGTCADADREPQRGALVGTAARGGGRTLLARTHSPVCRSAEPPPVPMPCGSCFWAEISEQQATRRSPKGSGDAVRAARRRRSPPPPSGAHPGPKPSQILCRRLLGQCIQTPPYMEHCWFTIFWRIPSSSSSGEARGGPTGTSAVLGCAAVPLSSSLAFLADSLQIAQGMMMSQLICRQNDAGDEQVSRSAQAMLSLVCPAHPQPSACSLSSSIPQAGRGEGDG